jgi:hypothetical protein
MLCLILAALNQIIVLWSARPLKGREGLRMVGLAVLVFVIGAFRMYIGALLLAAVLVTFLVAGVVQWRTARTTSGVVRAVGLVCLVAVPLFMANRIDLVKLLSPMRPALGYYRLGLQAEAQGQPRRAIDYYLDALQREPKFEPANARYQRLIESGSPPAVEPETDLASAYAAAKSEKLRQLASELLTGVQGLWPEAQSTLVRATPLRLNEVRQGYISSGGYSVMDTGVTIQDPVALVRYLPRVVTLVFGAPFAWQWLDTRGDTGVFRAFAALEMILLYGLLPGFAASCWAQRRRRETASWLLFSYALLSAAALGLTIANIGTLFRLRLQFLLPLVILACASEAFPRPYQRLAQWWASRVNKRNPAAPAPAPELAVPSMSSCSTEPGRS